MRYSLWSSCGASIAPPCPVQHYLHSIPKLMFLYSALGYFCPTPNQWVTRSPAVTAILQGGRARQMLLIVLKHLSSLTCSVLSALPCIYNHSVCFRPYIVSPISCFHMKNELLLLGLLCSVVLCDRFRCYTSCSEE